MENIGSATSWSRVFSLVREEKKKDPQIQSVAIVSVEKYWHERWDTVTIDMFLSKYDVLRAVYPQQRFRLFRYDTITLLLVYMEEGEEI